MSSQPEDGNTRVSDDYVKLIRYGTIVAVGLSFANLCVCVSLCV